MNRILVPALVLTLASACLASSPTTISPSSKAAGRPHGWSDRSYYLPMRDGVRLALSLYYPGSTPPARHAPAVLIQTRYGRAEIALKGAAPPDIEFFLAQGYVVAIVDVRGSTSSFGVRDVELGPAERADMDEIIAHLAAQSWSDGRVIAYGVSYMADTADLAASRPAPALVAAVPRQLDFDAYAHAFMPGGVLNEFLLFVWGRYTNEIDAGRSPRKAGRDCQERAEDCEALFPTLQPVDEDPDLALLRMALGGRGHWVPEDYADAFFRDDPGRNGYSMLEFSPAHALAGIRREAKPTMTWASWLDSATAEAALARFRSAPEVPMEIWITGNNHGHDANADPFFPERQTPMPDRAAQFSAVLDFMQRVLDGARMERSIRYYVLGAGEFRDTRTWPPEGSKPVRYYLTSERALAPQAPCRGESVRYDVDFGAGTGANTRWSTQFGPSPAYPDRRSADSRLAVFDTAPLDADMELVGTPTIDLHFAARSRDPALFVYLEDVAPDGRVTYVTEGVFRAIHRAPAEASRLPYDQGPAPHSFERADALPVTPGETIHVGFALNPVSALIRRGHSLRIAIAGADADVFRRHSEGSEDTFTFSVGGAQASSIDIPLRPWR